MQGTYLTPPKLIKAFDARVDLTDSRFKLSLSFVTRKLKNANSLWCRELPAKLTLLMQELKCKFPLMRGIISAKSKLLLQELI